ncbi:Two-component hybrid sensor and regulator [Devosia sp. LC5]|uniref:sensor histidine kinase n=1 Tax=Devosia sp. LC5 TaxID=1502724 RepID=UPI0004E358E6|nr:HAMP domain-containing sensor histidine kinase [Devosia sp. LC5]KFC68388.1 Two-component hybrid sensor and regulator [Devosia sp. LC5]
MDADWITSPSARRVLQHADDARPAWLWSREGDQLIWQNAAAGLFLAKIKKHGLKRAPLAAPIKGQVARNIRLGSTGRTSLARVQFLAGDKPASSTCATTPLIWQDGQPVLLIVGVDPIAAEILAAGAAEDDAAEAEAMRQDDSVAGSVTADGDADAPPESVTEVQSSDAPDEEMIANDVVGDLIVADEQAYEQELANWHAAEQDTAPATETAGGEPEGPAAFRDGPGAEWHENEDDVAAESVSRLAALVDRLAADEALFTPLTADDDVMYAAQDPDEPEAPVPEQLFRVTGRGFVANAGDDDAEDAEAAVTELAGTDPESVAAAVAEIAPTLPEDPEAVERVSRYNFDELSRILNDRVGAGEPAQPATPTAAGPPMPAPQPQRAAGALINLGGETLVLNRLPLGILVFRDQQVLFANRAITEMVGYDSVEQLRAAGLASVFPSAGPDEQEAGPVNHLMQRDGTLVPVTARLQSISWQGRPALMLSASATEVRTGHEAAVRAFAESFAELRGDGFFDANRAGVINLASPHAVTLLAEPGAGLAGRPLSGLVAEDELPALREFLERPARFAETARPCLVLASDGGKAEMTIFAQGQAGIVTGYFGFVKERGTAPVRLPGAGEPDPALLARISRGVRRPLNTIVGFSELIRSEAFGALGNERYEEYAQDIAAAGQEIAALVDELDDYARLRDGRYMPQRASIELTSLLESCVMRIRQQASNARVIVRNAISESLPRVTADRASLAQAVLNLLASAIDQTPTGGAVVISAQREDDGGIAIHVRDSSTAPVDMAERFVVFRDGLSREGRALAPVRSSVGLALTRSLLAVNGFALSVDPAGATGMLFTLVIPSDLVDRPALKSDQPSS